MIITDDMLSAAFCYRETNLWHILTDSDVFAFRLSDGETGYCCVMGNAGEHLALGFYKGKEGFTSYLNTTTMPEQQITEFEALETMMTFDCINCDFMSAADLNDKTKKVIRSYANANGVKIRRPNGWPDFTRHEPYRMRYGITFEEDARDITEALHAAIAVAGQLETSDLGTLGFDEKGNYPTKKGGKSVPYLIPNGDGTFEWSTTKLPGLMKREYVTPKFNNDILSSIVKALPKSDALQLRLIHLPASEESADKPSLFPALMLCVHPGTGYLFPIYSTEDVETNPMSLLVQLVNTFRQNKGKPEFIQVEDPRTEAFLKDFCHQCGIILSRESTLPPLNEAWNALIRNFMM